MKEEQATAGCRSVVGRVDTHKDLHIIAIGRLRTDARTKAYANKRVREGHSKLEAIRCLKRYIAREVYYVIPQRNRQIGQAKIAT
jgi:transposase